MLFIVLLSRVAWLFLSPVLDSDGSLHLLDYVRDFKLGLGHWAVDSMGAAWAFASQGCVRACVCVWAGGWCVKVCLHINRGHGGQLVSTWLHCLWHGPSNMNLFCFTLVRYIIFWTPGNFSFVYREHLFRPHSLNRAGKQRKLSVLLWERLVILLLLTRI